MIHFNYRIFPLGIFTNYSNRQTWADSVDPDQTPRSAASDLGLHCLLFIQQFATHQFVIKWTCSKFRASILRSLIARILRLNRYICCRTSRLVFNKKKRHSIPDKDPYTIYKCKPRRYNLVRILFVGKIISLVFIGLGKGALKSLIRLCIHITRLCDKGYFLTL